MITYFLHFRVGGPVAESEREAVCAIVAGVPGLVSGLVFTPEGVRYDYYGDGPPPDLAIQLYMSDLPALEAALAPGGHLQQLAALPRLREARATRQAMLSRRFPVPDATFRTPPGRPHCSFLVHYPGAAEDLNAWLSYYIGHHPAVMARFPGIRQIEVCTRIDWCDFLPWDRVDHFQRNKVVFDDGPALTAALASPVRQEMRADYHAFPPFTGDNEHFAMDSFVVPGRAGLPPSRREN